MNFSCTIFSWHGWVDFKDTLSPKSSCLILMNSSIMRYDTTSHHKIPPFQICLSKVYLLALEYVFIFEASKYLKITGSIFIFFAIHLPTGAPKILASPS